LFIQLDAYYNSSYIYVTESDKVNYTNFALNICFGKQILLSDIMTLDWYVGFGYGLQFSDAEDKDNYSYMNDFDWDWTPYAYSHTYLGRSFPMTLSGGLTIGVLFK
jgi:hypothetical protein